MATLAALVVAIAVAAVAGAEVDIAHTAEYQGTTAARDTTGTLSTGAQVVVQLILLALGWAALRSNDWAASQLKAADGRAPAAAAAAATAAAPAPAPEAPLRADPRPYTDIEADIKEADVAITLSDDEKELFTKSPRAPGSSAEGAEGALPPAAGAASSVSLEDTSADGHAAGTGSSEVAVLVTAEEDADEPAEAAAPATGKAGGGGGGKKKSSKRVPPSSAGGSGRGAITVSTGRGSRSARDRGGHGSSSAPSPAAPAAPVAPLAPPPAPPAGPTFFDHLRDALPIFNPINIWRAAFGARRETWLLLGACGLGLGTAVMAGLLADRAHVFGVVEKIRSVGLDLLVAITLVITGVALVRSRVTAPAGAPTTEDVVMGLRACEETKGWMMLVFLLYHYFDVKAVYNLVRVLVSTYVFLTGYGNALSLSSGRGAGVSWAKFANAFLRINLLVVAISLAMQQPYILYYICPLHTFYTLTTYALYSQRVARWLPHKGQRFLAAFLLLVLVWHIEALWSALFLPTQPLLVTTGDSMSEWAFRSKLDFLSAFAGSVFAELRPRVLATLKGATLPHSRSTAWGIVSEEETQAMTAEEGAGAASPTPAARASRARSLDAATPTPTGSALARQLKGWGLIAGCIGTLWLYAAFALPLPKASYNALHPYVCWVPIVAFFTLRSAASLLRRTHLGLFAYIGRHSLELYLLQFHVWLGYNAKTNIIPVSLPNRAVGSVLQTGLFLLLAVAAFSSTGNFIAFLKAKGGTRAHVLAMVVCLCLLCSSYSFAAGSGGGGGAGGR